MIGIAVVFLAMGAYGLAYGHAGAGIIALVMAVVVLYADRKFKQQERAWFNSPANADAVVDTASRLDEQDCECSRTRF